MDGCDPVARPKTRGDCQDGIRPCPFVSCRFHLLLDLNPETGTLSFPFGSEDLDRLPETCALDVAEKGPRTLDEIGKILNLTRERIRQVEVKLLRRLREGACED